MSAPDDGLPTPWYVQMTVLLDGFAVHASDAESACAAAYKHLRDEVPASKWLRFDAWPTDDMAKHEDHN